MRVSLAVTLFFLFGCMSEIYAQDTTSNNDKGFGVSFGTGLVSSRSKVDRLLPAKEMKIIVFETDITGKSEKIKFSGKLAEGGIVKSQNIDFNARGNALTLFGLGIGINADYFYAKEVDPLVREPDFLGDSINRKHYGFLGFDVAYGDMRKTYLRTGYMVGVAYNRIDSLFDFNNGDQVMTKLYDDDIQPMHMLLVEGGLSDLWRFKLAGSVRIVRTLEIAKYSNTSLQIPTQNVVADGSIGIYVWKSLSVHTNGTFSNNDRGRIFMGNSLTVLARVKF